MMIMMMMMRLSNILREFISSLGIQPHSQHRRPVYKHFRGRASLDQIKRALEHVDSYTLHKEYKRPRIHNPYYVYHRKKQFQADLIDIAGLKQHNDNITFLLVVIDVFSRKIWVIPLKRKTGKETANALRKWAAVALDGENEIDNRSLLTDSGKEFLNADVRSLMREKNIRMDQAKNINKAAVVERVNKSCLLYTSPSPRDLSTSRMPSSA